MCMNGKENMRSRRSGFRPAEDLLRRVCHA